MDGICRRDGSDMESDMEADMEATEASTVLFTIYNLQSTIPKEYTEAPVTCPKPIW